MVWKSTATILSIAAALAGVNAAAATNFSSSVDPTKIEIPQIPQTTSKDPVQQCTYYAPPVPINAAEWPTLWQVATSNGMNKTAEFQNLYKSIDWSKAPNIPVRKLTPERGLDTTGYDAAKDPDCWWTASQCVKPKLADVKPDIYKCPEPDTWGLTFDDGPNCSHNAFYDYLAENKQKASMFYIGTNVIAWPYGAMRGVKEGHHLAGHTWSHNLMTTLTNEEVLAELYYTQKAIKHITGVTPIHWRPAQGDLDDRVRWVATQLGLTAIIWNLDTDDWAAGVRPGVTEQTVNQHYEDFIAMGKNGTFKNEGNIVLSHEINNMTMDFAIKHYPEIKKSYKHVVDVATCMNISHPYLEQNVAFTDFATATGSKADAGSGSNAASGSGSNAASGSGAGSAAQTSNKVQNGAASVSLSAPLFLAALLGLLVVV
ncbi:hypothetical protein DFQ28_007957 [Apophysomyces sp. BC1034]|nr:hypothetical protein DFQ30_007677 [Apophysomyces sp. BC1015]KAG0176004.1 hypothetical protein DFQ29_006695 [Apophysomyces sp. BC1021]KAG0186366.1 hypothetical protein DFQ28_007957 [Apophysomyces sp. BC1034]